MRKGNPKKTLAHAAVAHCDIFKWLDKLEGVGDQNGFLSRDEWVAGMLEFGEDDADGEWQAEMDGYKQALEELNQVIVLYAWFLPALVEKFSVLMAMGDWDQAVETAQRVLAQDQHNIEALRLSVLFLLSQESRHDAAKNRISDLLQASPYHLPSISLASP